jgi:hypothetical protein
MTKPVTRKMAVDCLLWVASFFHGHSFHCRECGKPLLPGQDIQFDHLHADVHGGPHEYENLRPIHYDPCHKRKTARDVAANAKVKRIIADKPSKRPMQKTGRKLPTRPWPKRASL